jgi:hypothetical protein
MASCKCTSTSLEPCDYCNRELCESCADDKHECDGDACECDCTDEGPDWEAVIEQQERDRWDRFMERV